jgi:hypothetical protein
VMRVGLRPRIWSLFRAATARRCGTATSQRSSVNVDGWTDRPVEAYIAYLVAEERAESMWVCRAIVYKCVFIHPKI